MPSRAEITARYAKAYMKASKKDKGQILDQVVEVTGWSRDNARRRLTRRGQAAAGFGPQCCQAAAQAAGRRSTPTTHSKCCKRFGPPPGGQCGKYLAASMAVQLDGLERHGELVFGA